MTSVHTNNRDFFRFEKNIFWSENYFSRVQCSEPSSTRDMSSNGHHHRRQLAEYWSWIRSDGPRVPKQWRNEQKNFY